MNTSNNTVQTMSNAFPYTSEGAFYEAMYNMVGSSKYVSEYKEEDRHELVWGILERAWNRRGSFNPAKGKLENWMKKVIYSYFCDQYRKDYRYQSVSIENLNTDDYPMAGLESYEVKEKQLTALEKAIASLKLEDQQLIKFYEEGLSGREIASRLGISETNVRARISRIKSKFRGEKEIIICCDCRVPSCCRKKDEYVMRVA